MTLAVVFHELAENELNDAAAYYSSIDRDLAYSFLIEVENSISAILATPEAQKNCNREYTSLGGS